MTIHLPKDLERGIKAAVRSGTFASEDEAIAAAVRIFWESGLHLPRHPSLRKSSSGRCWGAV